MSLSLQDSAGGIRQWVAALTKVQLLIKIEEDQKNALQQEAKRYDLSLSDVVRMKLRKPLSLEEIAPYQVPNL